MEIDGGDKECQMGIILRLVTAVILFVASPVFGHHSPAAFDLDSVVALQGTVSRFDWRNPHVYIYVEVSNDSGEMTEWILETDPTPLMSRSGWTSSTLTPGDLVSFQLNPEKNLQRSHGLLVSLTKADGETLSLRSSGPAPKATARDISGIWDAQGNFLKKKFSRRVFTEAGIAAQATYTSADFPPGDCVPFSTPNISYLPYLNEIEIFEDRVLIRSEFYSVDRIVYMDGRDHPLNADRTNQGHSIGIWEGDTLIVDTTLFADDRTANGTGVPSGAQKHAIERFELSEDRSQLNVEIIIEDPEFLVEPFMVSTIWDYTPNRKMERFGCDPENARIYEFQ